MRRRRPRASGTRPTCFRRFPDELVRLRASPFGRFAPPPSVDAIDAAWLQQHVFDLPPEHVGALWDESVDGPEVAAVLARLTAEKKIESWTHGGEMSLRLLQPLDRFSGYEASLLAGLFFDGRTETSTAAVREHYQATGFRPVDAIKAELLDAIGKVMQYSDA